MKFGLSAIATIFSGGSLGAALKGTEGLAIAYAALGFGLSVDDLTSLEGKTYVEKQIRTKLGETYGDVYNGGKFAFTMYDKTKGLIKITTDLEKGKKGELIYDVINQVVTEVGIIVNPPNLNEKEKE